MTFFKRKNRKTQYNAIGYRIDENELEIDENGQSDRDIDCEVKGQKAIAQELGCKFIWIDPDNWSLWYF